VNAATLSRFERMVHTSAQSGMIEFDSESLTTHATGKHNYSMIVLFSSKEKNAQCPFCGPLNEHFTTLTNHYRYNVIGVSSRQSGTGYESSEFLQNPIFFVYCDVQKCKDFIVKAQWRELPKLFYIPPSDVKRDSIEMRELDRITEDSSIDRVSKFVAEQTKNEKLIVPEPFIQRVLPYIAGILALYAIITRVLPSLYIHYKRPMFWYILCLAAYAFAMAGTVFNSINKPPFSYTHPSNGQLYLIYPSQRQQFVAEGLIMAGLLTLCSCLFTAFGIYVPTFKGPWQKRGIYLCLLVSFYMVYDGIFKIFRMKYGYYPY